MNKATVIPIVLRLGKVHLVYKKLTGHFSVYYCEPKEQGAPKSHRNERALGKLQVPASIVGGAPKLFLYIPIPTALRSSSLPLPKLSRSHHLDLCLNFLLCSTKTSVQAKGKGKEHPRTIGMGGTGKTRRQFSSSNSRRLMLSFVFPSPLLLDPLFLPLPS
ncbi:hypothetical protein BRADI_5g10524v3 [Brachypodium distachyon]|uniref:Uncharacterized protein n=1 Tax=Brachypodium distachyon TaxID=15368 RepID=A0A0Q3E4S0_BRADI|nr:hypothetical protein BRADI_5g10524v3 [Brachypodium distachyon]